MASSLPPTELKNFLPLSKLGEGAFSTVYKVKRVNDGQIYALKKIKIQKLKQKQKQNALNQIRILASIKSKYIISYKEAFYDQSLNLLCIVMEYANGGDLQKKISDHQKAKTQFSEKQIWKAASQILIGLYVLHEKGILHRDLKSANVFVSNDEYKLGDLNVSKINYEKDQMARTQTGTPYYASPQVWRDEPYDSKCDIWSFGCLIYEMCCFEPPFQGADLDELYKSVQRGKYRQIPANYSSELGLLIRFCLKLSPKQRCSGKELLIKFKPLNEKFMECLKKNQLELENKLINTIRLPFDLKDLSKKLPLPQYQTQAKEQPRTVYHDDPGNKETVILKNKSGIDQQKLIEPLPQRIKSYFNQNDRITVRKRPQRPVTSSKRKQQKDQTKQIRPSSAHYVNKNNNNLQKVPRLISIRDHKIPNQIQTDHLIVPISLQKKDLNAVKPLNQIKPQKNLYNPHQYRCKSSDNQRRPIALIHSPKQKLIQKPNQNRFSSQKLNSIQEIQKGGQISQGLPENFSINQKIYENCKENSIKKISSLQKKVRYIRDQRKERKVILEKNKENISCILKPTNNEQSLDMKQRLKDKIKQNSQILKQKQILKNNQYLGIAPVHMPVIKERIYSGRSMLEKNTHQKTEIINSQLQKRKNNLISRRYIASADSKRVRSYTEISNEQTKIMNEREKKYRVIRKIPSDVIPSILADKTSSKNISSQPYMRRQPLTRVEMQNIRREDLGQNSSMIDNSDTIIRLKKRIKNRIIGHNSHQKNQNIIFKPHQLKALPIYY